MMRFFFLVTPYLSVKISFKNIIEHNGCQKLTKIKCTQLKEQANILNETSPSFIWVILKYHKCHQKMPNKSFNKDLTFMCRSYSH